jgi:ribosomal protein L32
MWLGNVWDRDKNIGSLYVFHRLCESKLNLGYGPRKWFRLLLQDDETTVRRNVCNYYSNYKISHHRNQNIQQHGYENLMRRSWIFG